MPATVLVPQLAGLEGEAEILEIATAAVNLTDGKVVGYSMVGLGIAMLSVIAVGPKDQISGDLSEVITSMIASYIAWRQKEKEAGRPPLTAPVAERRH